MHPRHKMVSSMPCTCCCSCLQERPRPSLHARCYLRLGMLQHHMQDAGGLAVDAQLSSCLELFRVSGVVLLYLF
jgi:hypothetical protein